MDTGQKPFDFKLFVPFNVKKHSVLGFKWQGFTAKKEIYQCTLKTDPPVPCFCAASMEQP